MRNLILCQAFKKVEKFDRALCTAIPRFVLVKRSSKAAKIDLESIFFLNLKSAWEISSVCFDLGIYQLTERNFQFFAVVKVTQPTQSDI